MKKSAITAFAAMALATMAFGQGRGGGGGGWSTARADAQRSGWEHSNGNISIESIQKGGFELQWKRKLENAPRQLNSLTNAAAAPGSGLNPPPTVIGGSSNNVYGIDDEQGTMVWARHFEGSLAPGTAACPGGLTASVSRPTTLNQVVASTLNRGVGRGRGPAQGAVGGPGEGVPMAMMAGGMFGPGGGGPGGPGGGGPGGGRGGSGGPGGPGGFGGPGGPGGGSGGRGGGAGPGGGPAQGIYAVGSDGVLHTLGQAQGKDIQKPVPFLPANANVTDMIAVNQIVYAATINGCGGVANGLWAIDLASDAKTVTSWKSGSSPVGSPAFSSTGTVYVAIGEGSAAAGSYSNAVVALDPKTLQVKDWISLPAASFASTPVIFKFQDQEIVAEATQDGRVFLLDAGSLGGADHKTALFASGATSTVKGFTPSAMATWEDSTQTRWLVLPAAGAKSNVIAYKVTGSGGKPTLQQGWVSRDLVNPGAPIVVNGLVFAISNGDSAKAIPAVLYALEGTTGKELWSSGKSITSFVHSGGIWAAAGQVYVPTHDATVFAFGFAMERH
jgi:hypothetical protein